MGNSWNQGADEASGGDYIKSGIGTDTTIQIAGMFEFKEKTFDEAKGPQQMCEIPAFDLANPTEDGQPAIWSCGKRKSQDLLRLCGDLDAKGIDPTTRAIRIVCVGHQHPTKAGRTIGRLTCTDLGPATEHGGQSVWAAGASDSGPRDGVDHINEIANAPTMDALRAAFTAAWKSTTDTTNRDLMTAAKDDRKAELEAGEDLPF